MNLPFIDIIKANREIKRMAEQVKELTADRDLQVAKLKEFETTNADYISSAETCNQMKTKHKQEIATLNKTIETIKAECETKLTAKDNDVAVAKQNMNKDIVAESIRIVASQGTNVSVNTMSPATMSPEQAAESFGRMSGEAKQKFYEANRPLFQSVLNKR